MRSRGLRSMRAISRAASAGSSPNFEPSWPVSTCAWVSAVTPGITRTSTSRAPAAGRLQPVDVVGVVDDDQADPVLDRQRDLLVGLGVAVMDDQRGVDAGLERGQDLAAAGDVEPEPLLDHHALDRRRRERLRGEDDARARPARRQLGAVLARPRAQRGLVDDQRGRAELARERRRRGSRRRPASRPRRARSRAGRARAERSRAANYSRRRWRAFVGSPRWVRRLRGGYRGGPCPSSTASGSTARSPSSPAPPPASAPRSPTGLAEAGADVAICARRADRLQQTAEQVRALGRRCLAVTADVAVPEDCTRVVEETRARARARRRARQQRRHRHRGARHARDPGASSGA